MELCFPVGPSAAGRTLYQFLRSSGVSGALIKKVKHHGNGFFADGLPVHTDYRVRDGQTIRFSVPEENETTVRPQPIPLHIAYEDAFALVLDKPAGMAVHPTLNYPDGTLANGYLYLMAQRGEKAVFRPVNRIDKDTSGLVLCAKNAFAAPLLARGVHKQYFAVVEGRLPPGSGRIDAPIGRRGESIIGRCVCPDGKPSVTEYTVLAAAERYSLVRCIPVTGRTHQIRVHFAHLGHPLAGDDLYGGKRQDIGRQALHCGVMEFIQPVSEKKVRVCSPFPEDMLRFARLFEEEFDMETLPVFGQSLPEDEQSL